MKPADTLPHDRRAYFHNSVISDNGVPKLVRVDEGGRFYGHARRDEERTLLPIGGLAPYWPLARAVNIPEALGAVAFRRRARQSRRRSGHAEHYHMSLMRLSRYWHPGPDDMLWALLDPTPYPTWDKAMKLLTEEGWAGVAVSEDLVYDGEVLYWDGEPVGRIRAGLFYPLKEASCFTKLARAALLEVNPACL